MIINRKRGSALIQVLVLGGVIAGVVVLLLRFSVSRATNVVKTTRKMSAKAFAEGCMAQFTARSMMRELHGRPPAPIEGFSPQEDLFTRVGSSSDQSVCIYDTAAGGTPEERKAIMRFEWTPVGDYFDESCAPDGLCPIGRDRVLIMVTVEVENTQDWQ